MRDTLKRKRYKRNETDRKIQICAGIGACILPRTDVKGTDKIKNELYSEDNPRPLDAAVWRPLNEETA
jgi:hypothetical protein